MANRLIFSTVFRVSFPHLASPQEPQKPGDEAKYGISMMFPKTGVCPINNQPASYQNIIDALNECTMEQWNLPYDQAIAPGMGIQFPPKFKDGDTVFQKDANGNPIPGRVAPETAGMWILSVKNVDPVGCVGPDSVDIAPAAIYAGSWARAQLECSAYDGKQGRVIVVKLVNVQLCYNDTPFGNKPVHESASKAFGSMTVADTNVEAGAGQAGAMPPVATPPGTPGSSPPGAAAAPPTAPTAGVTTPPGNAPAATAPQVAPGTPTAPPPGTTAVPPAATAPASTHPVATPPPGAPATPPANDPVIMNPGEPPYADMIAAGWTNELLVQHGKGVLNYTA